MLCGSLRPMHSWVTEGACRAFCGTACRTRGATRNGGWMARERRCADTCRAACSNSAGSAAGTRELTSDPPRWARARMWTSMLGSRRDAADGQREGLQEMKIGPLQRVAAMRWIAQPAELVVISARQVRPQSLGPGAAKHSFEKVVLVGGTEWRDPFDQQGANAHVVQPGATQQTDDGAHCRELALRDAVTVAVIAAHGLIRQPLEARVPRKVHVGEERA